MAVSTSTETVTVLRLAGDIGMSDMDALLSSMTDLVLENKNKVVLNFRQVKHVSLNAISKLANGINALKPWAGKLSWSASFLMSRISSSWSALIPTLTWFSMRMKPSPVLTADQIHLPVLLKEAVELLCPPPDGVVLDLTVGMGGHSQELLKLLPRGRLVGLDQDVDALQHAGLALRKDPRVSLFKANFADLLWVLKDLSISEVDSVLMDIGVSSLQLDSAHRGFSFNQEGPLDMRMDTTTGHTAAWVLNTYPEEKLSKIIFEYGEEPKARALARAIVKARAQKPIENTSELADLAKRVCGRPRPKGKGSAKHPATRLFQAIRIEVNRELEILEKGLKTSLECSSQADELRSSLFIPWKTVSSNNFSKWRRPIVSALLKFHNVFAATRLLSGF